MTSSLRRLPKVRDSLSYVYFDRCRIEQDAKSIAVYQEDAKYVIPCASLTTLLLGPGTAITHAAIKALADNSCAVHWVGEDGLRFYARGVSSSSSVSRLYHQAELWVNPAKHLQVVRRMYEFRFQEPLKPDLTLEQIRGLEGVRVRTAYGRLSKATGVEWKGRDYKLTQWQNSDPINRALSAANSCLYAVCQAALNTVGYSSALGFIHTGKPLSFVYDVADLYKTETTVPAAFETVAEFGADEKAVRRKCHEKFSERRLMPRIIQDIDRILEIGEVDDTALPVGQLWDPEAGTVEGGQSWGEEKEDQAEPELEEE